jgi:NADH-quinone oxidoreductase subunit L
MQYQQYILLIPLLPLATFVLLGLFGRKQRQSISGAVGTMSMLTATVLSLVAAFHYFFIEGKANGIYQKITVFHFNWLQFSPNVSIDMGVVLDAVSVMMIVIITFISLMVHVFSLGYMKGERRFGTYYAFLSLFTFSMLGLVLASNIFQVYVFWELVGVSSYLLIGFYFDKPSAVAASKKAFIVTRFADFGFLVGILILGFYGGTLDIAMLIQRLTTSTSPQFIAISTASFAGISVLSWALTLVFIGGAGKSAMFPLHIWLPDAMEGPTPVSALIHAATMVVAGVYLVARLFPVFSVVPGVLDLVNWVGVSSAFIAACIACTQSDIKRVLAYSTMSQIGYMMFALGISTRGIGENAGYTASLFHLFTHAFFKSLLFLAAGAVIHLVHTNRLEDMGGLRKRMPVTHLAFLVGCLAIAGIPPFAGFFSKEEILAAAFHSNKFIYTLALFTSALTAFYMFRLYFSIFWNKPITTSGETSDQREEHSEGTISMKLPLLVLASCSVAAGFVPFSSLVTESGLPVEAHLDLIFSIPPVVLSALAIVLAARLYKKANERPARMALSLGALYTAIKNKLYIDELYLYVTKNIIFRYVGRPAAWIDRNVIDGSVNGMARVTEATSNVIRWVQSGRVQQYALCFFAGVCGLAIVFVYLWK